MADLKLIRRTAIRWLAACVGWLAAAVLSWAAVLALEVFYQRSLGASPSGILAYLVQQSMKLSLAASAVVLLLHAFRVVLLRTGRWYKLLMALVVLGVASYPARDQALFLTSGAGISSWQFVRELAIALFMLLIAAHYALWRWHVRGLTAATPERAERSGLRAFVAGYAWSLSGMVALMALIYVLSFELQAYAYFARFLLVPTWLVATTLIYRTCGGPTRSGAWAIVFAVALLGADYTSRTADPGRVAAARTDSLRRGKITALNDVLTRPNAKAFTSFDLRAAEAYDCALFEPRPPPPPLATDPEKRKNVLIISIDALRRDALSWVEDGRPVMPQLRNFAARSIDFERAVTTYPATLFSVGGALTGLNASQLLFAAEVPDNVFKISRKRFGNQFAALPESGWFKKSVVNDLFLQGVKHEHFPDANAQTAWFIRRLKKARREKGGVLGWIHYYEPHPKYYVHEDFEFGSDARQRYMSEVAYVDHHMGRLLRFLSRNDWYEDTMVIVMADHGQALGERDYYGHHVYLNSWLTDIPLLVRAPGVRARKDPRLVDITDVATTITHFGDLPSPRGSHGVSLLANPEGADERLSFTEAFPVRGKALFKMADKQVTSLSMLHERMDKVQSSWLSYVPKVSVVSASHRLVVDRITGHEELYDRRVDPQEVHELSATHTGILANMRRELKRWSALQAAEIYCRVSQAEWERGAGKDAGKKKKKSKKKKEKKPATAGAE